MRPAEIERRSMEIIAQELGAREITLPAENAAVIKRVIHATADFDYAASLRFTPGAVSAGIAALRGGIVVTDTNMALAGLSRRALELLGAEKRCYMADAAVASEAKTRETTRAAVSMEHAFRDHAAPIFAVGNAPTALFAIAGAIEGGRRPALVIAVPVGFVNVVEAKERVFAACETAGVPCIAAFGRKGGSSVAAAIVNALLYEAAGLADPALR